MRRGRNVIEGSDREAWKLERWLKTDVEAGRGYGGGRTSRGIKYKEEFAYVHYNSFHQYFAG
jgi:hypothetical protein